MAEMRDRPEAPEGDRPREPESRVEDRLRARFSRMEAGADETPPPGTAERIADYRRKYQESLAPVDPDEPRIPTEMAGTRGRVERRQNEPEKKGPEPGRRRPDAATDRVRRSDAPDETKLRIERPDSDDVYDDKRIPNSYDADALNDSDGKRKPLFDGSPRREDAVQGAAGDCGAVALMRGVAGTAPGKIIDAVKENPDGTYAVTLYQVKTSAWPDRQTQLSGRKITYTVTPDLPAHDSAAGLYGVRADKVTWAAVLEKAIAGLDQAWSDEEKTEWAELWAGLKQVKDAERVANGEDPFPDGPVPSGYVRISQGSDEYARADLLSTLTGREAEVRELPGDDDELVKALFADKIAYDKPVFIGSRPVDYAGGEKRLGQGVDPGHVYEVIGLTEDGLIELENPWGIRHPEPMTIAAFRDNFRRGHPGDSRPGLYTTLS